MQTYAHAYRVTHTATHTHRDRQIDKKNHKHTEATRSKSTPEPCFYGIFSTLFISGYLPEREGYGESEMAGNQGRGKEREGGSERREK